MISVNWKNVSLFVVLMVLFAWLIYLMGQVSMALPEDHELQVPLGISMLLLITINGWLSCFFIAMSIWEYLANRSLRKQNPELAAMISASLKSVDVKKFRLKTGEEIKEEKGHEYR